MQPGNDLSLEKLVVVQKWLTSLLAEAEYRFPGNPDAAELRTCRAALRDIDDLIEQSRVGQAVN